MGRDRGRWPRKVQHAREELPPRALQCGLLHLSVLDRAMMAVEGGKSYQESNSAAMWLGTQTAPATAFRRDKEGCSTLGTPLTLQ